MARVHTTTRPSSADLCELLSRSTIGDQEAFREFYDRTAPRVFGLVLRLLRDRAQAEEVTQEVYLQAWQAAAGFDSAKGSVMPWLITLAHRRAVDRARSADACRRRDDRSHRLNPEPARDPTADLVVSSFDGLRVRAALSLLSPVQREAIELAYFSGYTHTEIADITGAPLGTTKTRIRTGLLNLRANLDDTADATMSARATQTCPQGRRNVIIDQRA